jgi:hypothetical protein
VNAAIVSGIASIGASVQSARVEHPINSVREIRASLRACWISPEMSVPPQVTLRLSLKRNGEILGQPLISYENPHISEADRLAEMRRQPLGDDPRHDIRRPTGCEWNNKAQRLIGPRPRRVRRHQYQRKHNT